MVLLNVRYKCFLKFILYKSPQHARKSLREGVVFESKLFKDFFVVVFVWKFLMQGEGFYRNPNLFWNLSAWVCYLSCVMCEVSHVTCHMSHVMCHFFFSFFFCKQSAGSTLLSTGPTPCSLYWKSHIVVCSYCSRTFLWIFLYPFFCFLLWDVHGKHFQKTNCFHRHIVTTMLREMITKSWGWLKTFLMTLFKSCQKAPAPVPVFFGYQWGNFLCSELQQHLL